jgi:dTDP-4-amino-4,6-dideoxy-D-galactose acyltransferase
MPSTKPLSGSNNSPALPDLCSLLDWDSKFFGLNIGRVNVSRLSSEMLPRIREWCALHRIQCLYLLADADDPETSQLAGLHGFQFVDIRMTLERCAHLKAVPVPSQCPVAIREFQPADLPDLRKLAGQLHLDTRFFFDRHFPSERSRELYGVWMERCCLDPCGRVYVVERESRPAGYITCSSGEGQAGRIELVGVEPRAQGLGAGYGLVIAALNWLGVEGVRRVTVVTQGRNVPAQRLYQKAGFVTQRVQLWYHLWFQGGSNVRDGEL